MVNLFILLPESEPNTQWNSSNEQFQNEHGIVSFIQDLKLKLDATALEEYDGFYDNLNIKNFLLHFEEVADYYPNPAFRLLRSILQPWNNWRDDIKQNSNKAYTIFNQSIENHTFCEIAERQLIIDTDKFAILNHYGHELGSLIEITVQQNVVPVSSFSTEKEISAWFANERVPIRDFQITEKHGENRQEIIMWRGREASPLRCSKQEAFELLKFAIGDSITELFNYDEIDGQGYFIVFKFEGDTPQNMYHGYHVSIDLSLIHI